MVIVPFMDVNKGKNTVRYQIKFFMFNINKIEK